MSRRSNAHEQCVTRCPVFRLVNSPGRPASVVSWKISNRDPGVTILGSQLTGLAWLTCNRKVDFCCVYLRCPDLRKASQPGSCNQALSFIDRFYAFPLDLTDFSKFPEPTHPTFHPSPKHLHTSFSKLNELALIHVLSTQILSRKPKDNRKQKAQQHLKQVQV